MEENERFSELVKEMVEDREELRGALPEKISIGRGTDTQWAVTVHYRDNPYPQAFLVSTADEITAT